MRKILVLAAAAVCLYAQNTPNVGLQLPPRGSTNWNVPLNYNFTLLDQYLGGLQPVPSLSVSGALTAPGLVLSSTKVTSALGYTPQAIPATVGALPTASTHTGQIMWVFDGASATDCSAGLGVYLVACKSDGSHWNALQVGSSGVSGTGGSGGLTYSQQFSNQSTVTLTHNFNSTNIVAACYDLNNQQMTPGSVILTDANDVTMAFAAPFTGRCVVNAGSGTGTAGSGAVGATGPNYNFPFANQSSLTIAHNLNTSNVLVQCYDASNNFLIPGQITITDANNISVAFAGQSSGRCIVNSGVMDGGNAAGGGGGGGGTVTEVINEYTDMSTKGVVANGSTDNRLAIQSALSTIAANANGTNHRVYFPPGTYAISDTITVPTKTEVYGNGIGDPGVGATTFIPTGTFPSGHPMFQLGTSSTALTQRSSIHDMNIACESTSGVGVYKFNAQEQTSVHHIVFLGCGDTGMRTRGTNSCGGVGGCNGYSEHDGPDHDLEMYPDHWASSTTTCFDVADDQNYHGIENVTCTGTNATTKPNYGAKLACSGCSAKGIHFETVHNGMQLGASTTQGITGALIYNVDGTTGVDGNVLELESNSTNQPSDIHMYGISGGGTPIKNLAYPLSGDGHTSMDIGQQFGGNASVHNGDFGGRQDLFGNLQLWNGLNSQITGHLWCNKANGGTFPNFCLDADNSGNWIFGTGASGGHDIIFDNPYQSISLAQQATTENGLNLQGAIGDTSNSAQSMVANNLRYYHPTGTYRLPGNSSGEADGWMSVNPGGVNPVRTLGGYGIFAQIGLAENSDYTQSQVNTWFDVLFPTSGGMILFGEYRSRPTCDAAHREMMWFNFDGTGTNDSISYCGYQGGTLGWQGFGSGGGSGSITLNGTTGTTFNLPTFVNGAGTQIVQTGSGSAATIQANIAPTVRNISGADSPTGSDCGNIVWVTGSSSFTVTLPQPTLANTFAGCSVRYVTAATSAGTVTFSATNSTIVSNRAMTQTSGATDCTFTAINSSTWKDACAAN